ncbi:MAG: hypothetical protein GY810_15695 [Aureispira sp.]|nr:hypothetical protein [Aureispira sp.]
MARKWAYNSLGKEYTIHYIDKSLWMIKDGKKSEIPLSFLFGWPSFYEIPREIAYDVYKLVTNDHTMPSGWVVKLQSKWQFWMAIDNSKIEEQSFDLSSSTRLVLDAYGTCFSIDEEGNSSPNHKNYRSLYDVFFFGPNITGLSLSIRKTIQEAIWKALDHSQIDFTIEYSCVLFDYNKIKGGQKWEVGDSYKGAYIILHGTYVEVSSWYENRSSTKKYSVENFWYNSEKILDKGLRIKKSLVQKILETAIIEKGHQAPRLDI